MGKALQRSAPRRQTAPHALAPTETLLVQGGDARLTLDPCDGLNKYGCPPSPRVSGGGSEFASSTASTISNPAFAAAAALRGRLAIACQRNAAAGVYARELDELRGRLLALNGLADMSGLDVAFAASGTDLHLIVSELVGGDASNRLLCLSVEAEETGSGVPQALQGRHFSQKAALGAAVTAGAPISGAERELIAIAARAPDGALRAGAEVEAELDDLILAASRAGRRVLLTVADVSKTGLIAPSLAAVMALRHRFPHTLEVLVDACQFRLAPTTLRAYLEAGMMVAVTGSKFLTGPTFSGALLVPAPVGARLKERLLRPGLGLYSARAEWPSSWVAGAGLPAEANFGLLLRWRAAMTELEAFRALPEARVTAFVRAFADAVEAHMEIDPMLAPLATRPLDRRAIMPQESWDATPTIFAFALRAGETGLLSAPATQGVYHHLARAGVRLGQPVACGRLNGVPTSALRLCASARLVVEAINSDGGEAVIDRALSALAAVSAAARAQA
jgi:hypothetical protein